ncbi:hypothetical protein SBADM41S_01070 [Streptomyces badius]
MPPTRASTQASVDRGASISLSGRATETASSLLAWPELTTGGSLRVWTRISCPASFSVVCRASASRPAATAMSLGWAGTGVVFGAVQ